MAAAVHGWPLTPIAYYDTAKDLGVMIELLEFNSDMEAQHQPA